MTMTNTKRQTNTTTPFAGYEFTSAGLDLMAEVVRERNQGFLRPAKATRAKLAEPRFRVVRRWAEQWARLIGRGKTPNGGYGMIYLSTTERLRRGSESYLYPTGPFSIIGDMPVEALWRLVRPMLHADTSTGFSLARNDGWLALDIAPHGHRYHTDRDRREMEDVLDRLATYGYITFQAMADVWEIWVRTDRTPAGVRGIAGGSSRCATRR